jgi:tRNA A-37 threonylcarbamoyl transferase component Bud32
VVRRAIRHANKGGVFEATDRLSGEEVVIKQARAKVAQGAGGWDLQVALRNEAEMLDRLSRSGSTPRLIALFEQEGDLFCVQERVQGRTLRSWRDEQPPGDPCWEMAGQVVALLASVHAAGVVLRDLSPLNLMVRTDGGLTLIDLEFAARPGTVGPTARTPAYSAPEQCDELAADFAADLYALGRVLFLLCTGADPILPPDEPVVRSGSDRLAAWLRLVAATDEQVRQLEPLILGLVQDRPEQRWPLDRVADFLVRRPQADRGRPEPTGESEAGLDRLLTDAVDYLLGSMTPEADRRLWPGSKNGAQGDGCNVYHGAGGVLATLTTITALTGDERVRDGVRIAADWLAERVTRQDPLPGLYFGRSGTAWALTEAAALLGDRDLSGQALAVLDRLPPSWPNPDVTHGLAGAGYAALAVGTAGPYPALLTRARRYAEQLADCAERREGLVLWPVPDSFDSKLAGLVDYGFAHGAAGIACYLLAAGNRLGEPSWVELAAETADGLGKVAVENGREARWTSGPRNRIEPLEQWCSGSAGIGTFLIRVAHVTGESRAAELAEKAAEAVWSRRWQAGPSDCHGLAGGGQFLLDLADLTGDERYRRRAGDLADVLLVRAARRDGLLLAPDETMTGFGADYSVGISGWLAFLVRLRYGGARPWMVEP